MLIKEQIDTISKYFQLILVGKSIGRIENTEVVKEGGSFKNIKKYINYNLIDSKKENTLFFNIIKDLEKCQDFEKSENQVIKYFKLNLLQKIFLSDRKKRLIKKIQEMSKDISWLIVPKFIIEDFLKIKEFEPEISDDKLLFGFLNNISIYMNPNITSKEIYFGNYNSFKVIVNSTNLDFCLTDKTNLKVLNLI